MSTNWPFSADYKSRIDNWLKGKDPELLQKAYKVVKILLTEKEFRGKDVFKIPLDRFRENELGFGNFELILTSLNSIGTIEVYRRFPNSRSVEPLGLNPEIAQDKDTEIHIFTDELIYLGTRLKELLQQKEDVSSYFGFNDKTFWIKNMDGNKVTWNLSPKGDRKKSPDHYFVFRAFIEIIRRDWNSDGDWIQTIATKEQINEEVKVLHYPNYETRNQDWIANAVGNLKKAIPQDLHSSIKVGYFDRSKEGYSFLLKILR